MKITWLIFILLSLCTVNAGAKKLYKYQDEQGVFHYTDKPPKTEQPVAVRQLKVASKQLVWLLQSGEEHKPQFYIRNDYEGPVEVEVNFSEQENARTTPALPKRFVIEPGQSDTLFEVGGIDQNQSWRYTLQYRYTIGSPLTQYSAVESYLPPIAPDASFQVSQAFGGSFSHTDEQNKYAVDIVMPIGTPVHAAKAGMVVEVENDFFKSGTNKAYGAEANSIRILHDDGSMAIYAHLELEKAQVFPGLRVTAGQLIGYSGNTGFSSGPHLHFVVQINKGMELVSIPFTFTNRDGQAVEPIAGAWLNGVKPSTR